MLAIFFIYLARKTPFGWHVMLSAATKSRPASLAEITAYADMSPAPAMLEKLVRYSVRKPAALLDWNNNYGAEPDICVSTHCGNYPPTSWA